MFIQLFILCRHKAMVLTVIGDGDDGGGGEGQQEVEDGG